MRGRYKIYPKLKLLWELVQAMNRFEIQMLKDSARVKAVVAEIPAYLVFFDVLLNCLAFDETKIRKALEGTTTPNDLTDSKSYLYHAILKAIQAYNGDMTTDVSEISAQIKVLVHKGLYPHIPDLYETAWRFADETEDFEAQLRLIRLWKSALFHNVSGETLRVEMQKVKEREKLTTERLLNVQAWQDLFDLRFVAKSSAGEARAIIIQEINESPLVLTDGPCLSVRATVLRLSVKEKMLSIAGLIVEERIPIMMEIARVIEQHPALLEDVLMVERYLYAVFHAGLFAIQYNQEEIVEESLQKLTEFVHFRKDAEVLIYERVVKIRLLNLLYSLRIDEAGPLATQIREGLESYAYRLSPRHRIDLMLDLCYYYFLTKDFTSISKLLVNELNEKPTISSTTHFVLLWMYYLLSQFELDKADILHQYAGFAAKYLKRHGFEDHFGTIMVSFFRRYARKNTIRNRHAELERFGLEISTIAVADPMNFYIQAFPIEKWTQCKQSGKDLLDVLLKSVHIS
jgi:hypothetical protein